MKRKFLKIICLSLCCVLVFGLCSCGNRNTNKDNPQKDMSVILPTEVSIGEIVKAVKDVCGDTYLPNKELTAKEFNEMLDIEENMYEEFYAEVSSDESIIDKFFIVKTEDPITMQQKFEDFKIKSMNPENENFEKNQARLANSMSAFSGKFVFYYILGNEYKADENIEENEKISQEIQHYIQENQKVMLTITDTINNWQPPTLEEYSGKNNQSK